MFYSAHCVEVEDDEIGNSSSEFFSSCKSSSRFRIAPISIELELSKLKKEWLDVGVDVELFSPSVSGNNELFVLSGNKIMIEYSQIFSLNMFFYFIIKCMAIIKLDHVSRKFGWSQLSESPFYTRF